MRKTLLLVLMLLLLADCSKNRANEISSKYENSVILVCNMYYLKAAPKGLAPFYIGKDITGTRFMRNTDKQKLLPFITFGSGFFISPKGLIVTNRHVAYPWEKTLASLEDDYSDMLDSISYEQVFVGILPSGSIVDISDDDTLVEVANKVSRSFYKCSNLLSHSNPDVDLALIQMEAKSLPPDTTFIPLEKISSDDEEYEKGSDVYMIGYPGGLSFATARKTLFSEIENTLSSGIISKSSDKYVIQYNLSTGSGSSGSPIFDANGSVIAVNYAVSDLRGALINHGVKAHYIHELAARVEDKGFFSFAASTIPRVLLLLIPLLIFNGYRVVKEEIIEMQYRVFGSIKLSIYFIIFLILIKINNFI